MFFDRAHSLILIAERSLGYRPRRTDGCIGPAADAAAVAVPAAAAAVGVSSFSSSSLTRNFV